LDVDRPTGGPEQWIFEAKEAGTTTIMLDYTYPQVSTFLGAFDVKITVEE
jgi:predicted secreted protein